LLKLGYVEIFLHVDDAATHDTNICR